MTDGSVLGDICDARSPRHDSAMQMWMDGWARLPSHEYPPDVTLHDGDMCKVRGQIWVYTRRGGWDTSYAWEPCA